jgi:MSHA biogenesis protein MshJ
MAAIQTIRFQRLVTSFKALKRREKILIAACVLAFLYLVVDLLVVSPRTAERKKLQADIARHQADLVSLTQEFASAGGAGAREKGNRLREEKQQLTAAVGRADAMLPGSSQSVRAIDVLRGVGTQQNLRLISLRTMPSEAIAVAPATSASTPAAAGAVPVARPAAGGSPSAAPQQIYRTGVELIVQGTYPALAAFLSNVERSAPKMLWGEVVLETTVYPETKLKLTLYNLDTKAPGLLE